MEVARPFCEPDSMTVFAMLITVDFSSQTFETSKELVVKMTKNLENSQFN